MEKEIQHFSHHHPLILIDKEEAHIRKKCSLCELPISGGGPSYGCGQCEEFVIHKSCAEFPQHQIQHPFHPLHPLTFSKYPGWQLRCGACYNQSNHFRFRCESCDFTLCVKCTSLAPTIKYEGHEHLLTLFEKIYKFCVCKSCHIPSDAFVFRCVECDFNVDTKCLPTLPRTIKHKCHIHPLTLTDIFLDEIDDSDGFYCNACEEERDPVYPVYHCAECHFAVEIGCIISEVLSSLIAHQESNAWAVGVEVTAYPVLAKIDGSLISEQESGTRAKETETKPASTVEGFLGATAGDEVMAGGVSAAMPSEKVGVEVTADPILAKLDGSLISEQESSTREEETEIKPASIVEGFLGATAGDEVMAGGVSAAMPSEKVGVVVTADPILAKLDGSLISEQESSSRAKETEIKLDSTVEGFLGATMARGVSAAMPSEKVGVKVIADPALAKLDGEIAKLRAEVEALESERAQYVASKMLSARDEVLE